MIICLEIGNTNIYAGVFDNNEIILKFRYPSKTPFTADTFGIFLKDVLLKNGLNDTQIQSIILCSVVPALVATVNAACIKYLNITAIELKPGIKTGIKLSIKNPHELGADRIANAVAAVDSFPNKNLIIVNFGTATTICAINKNKSFLGGAIIPGIKSSIESLIEKTSKISDIEIYPPKAATGKTTACQLQSGLLYGQLGAIKEISLRIQNEEFNNEKPILISTGSYASLFDYKNIFTINIPDLSLHGLNMILQKNIQKNI